MDVNWQLVAGNLQQRMAMLVANYEGDIAILQQRIEQLQQELANKDEDVVQES